MSVTFRTMPDAERERREEMKHLEKTRITRHNWHGD
jgi:hypothetical protein